MSGLDQHVAAFLEEAHELLAELEADPGNPDLVNRVFRAMHTIKGSGSMFGFTEVAEFTHHVESVLDRVREGQLPVTKELIDLVLASRDHIIGLLGGGQAPADPEQGRGILDGLQALGACPVPAKREAPVEPLDARAPGRGETATYRLRVRLNPAVMQTGLDPGVLLAELRDLGQLHVTAQTEDVPLLGELDPEVCYLWWDGTLVTAAGLEHVRDVFIFVEDGSDIQIDLLGTGGAEFLVERRLGEILVERGDVTPHDLRRALGDQRRTGELLVASGAVAPERVESALAEQQAIRQQRESAEAASIRVAADKLDQLINLVGELVITQAQLSQVAGRTGATELGGPVENVERLTSELRDCVLNVRMLPIGTTFNRFRRLVRDLSGELGKEVDLATEGGETEVDKTVIERLNDPLVHLIRNCIDHGIESPDERAAAGKPRRGRVLLSAAHAGGEVVVTIADDGAGVDARRVAAKACEKGLVASADGVTEADALELLFAPGFSMAERVTDVSGRGVGMDVVRREIERLRGSVSLQSTKGAGTQVTFRLPLTLAIVDGLLTVVGGQYYVIQLAEVRECVELTDRDVANAAGRHILTVRGTTVPYIRLRETFRIPGRRPPLEQVVIVEAMGRLVGLVVDEVIGDSQTVIKPLAKAFAAADAIAGSTILGDGTVALILDVLRLVQRAYRDEDRRLGQLARKGAA